MNGDRDQENRDNADKPAKTPGGPIDPRAGTTGVDRPHGGGTRESDAAAADRKQNQLDPNTAAARNEDADRRNK